MGEVTKCKQFLTLLIFSHPLILVSDNMIFGDFWIA